MATAIRVLYVDDEPDLLEIGRIFLEGCGDISVHTTDSAPAALHILLKEKYDIIVSDYQMPGMDGILFLKAVRERKDETPFIIFTGRGREEVVIEALNNGADFYVQKGGDSTAMYQELSNKIRYAFLRKVAEQQVKVNEIVENEMEYHEQELIKFYNTALDAANKKLKLLHDVTRYDIISQLTVLQLSQEMLERKLSDPSCHEYVQKIGIAIDRISSILQFTRNYEEIGVNTPVWINISAIVELAKNEGVLGNLQLFNDIPAGTEVFSDALITNVFYNLMDNAVRYGGKITAFRLSLRESGENRVIVCEDDGVGIPAGEKEKIFWHGFGKNAGFGLFLSREILASSGITILETGEPGRGGRFEITIPNGSFRIVGTGKDSPDSVLTDEKGQI